MSENILKKIINNKKNKINNLKKDISIDLLSQKIIDFFMKKTIISKKCTLFEGFRVLIRK